MFAKSTERDVITIRKKIRGKTTTGFLYIRQTCTDSSQMEIMPLGLTLIKK